MGRSIIRLYACTMLLAFLNAKVQAQADTTHRWSIGMVATPGIAYRTLSVTGTSAIAPTIMHKRDQREDPRSNVCGQIALRYRLSPLFSLESGIGYALLGWQQNIDMSAFTFGDMIDPRRGFLYPTSDPIPSSMRLLDSYHYVEIPVQVSLHLGHSRFRSVTSIGISTSYLARYSSTAITEYADGSHHRSSTEETSSFKQFGLFPTISSGVSYQVSDRMQLQVQPTFRYGVLNVIDAPITANLWSAGLAFSAWLKL
jgi:hypothetical protein